MVGRGSYDCFKNYYLLIDFFLMVKGLFFKNNFDYI